MLILLNEFNLASLIGKLAYYLKQFEKNVARFFFLNFTNHEFFFFWSEVLLFPPFARCFYVAQSCRFARESGDSGVGLKLIMCNCVKNEIPVEWILQLRAKAPRRSDTCSERISPTALSTHTPRKKVKKNQTDPFWYHLRLKHFPLSLIWESGWAR